MTITLRDLTPLAASVARRLAKYPDEPDDMMQVALFAAHRYQTRINAADKPYALAKTIMQKAVWAEHLRNTRMARAGFVTVELQPSDAVAETNPDIDIEIQEFLDALESEHGITARRLAAELITPSHCGHKYHANGSAAYAAVGLSRRRGRAVHEVIKTFLVEWREQTQR